MVEKQLTLQEFKVLMCEFSDVIDKVAREHGVVTGVLGRLHRDYDTVTSLWQSPAAHTFTPLAEELRTHSNALDDVLGDMVRRMRATYSNYLEVERQAEKNLTQKGPPPPPNGGGGCGNRLVDTSDHTTPGAAYARLRTVPVESGTAMSLPSIGTIAPMTPAADGRLSQERMTR